MRDFILAMVGLLGSPILGALFGLLMFNGPYAMNYGAALFILIYTIMFFIAYGADE